MLQLNDQYKLVKYVKMKQITPNEGFTWFYLSHKTQSLDLFNAMSCYQKNLMCHTIKYEWNHHETMIVNSLMPRLKTVI
jgi:hypothetical protein